MHASLQFLFVFIAGLAVATAVLTYPRRKQPASPVVPAVPAGKSTEDSIPVPALLRSAPILMVVLDDEDRVVMVSDALAQTVGMTSNDVVGQRPDELPPTDLLGVAARIAAQPGDTLAEHETGVSAADGVRHYRVSAYPLPRGSGGGRAAMAVDVTAERRVQAVLSATTESAERQRWSFKQLIDMSRDQMLVLDTDFRIAAFNQSCQRAFREHYGTDLELGGYLDEALSQTGAVGERVIVQWSRALAGEEFTEDSAEGEGRNRRHCTTSFSTLVAPNGRLIGAAMLVRDVTELRSLEDQLRQSQKLEAVGQLTGGIAHEINNLLTVVNATCDILRETLAGAGVEIRRDLEAIRGAAGRGTTLIRKLLSFSRRQPIEVRTIDLPKIVYELSNVLSRILPEHVTVDTRVLPPVSAVLADPGAVEQIVINLATNARDAMPDGGRFSLVVHDQDLDTTFCATRPGSTPGKYVCIAATDTGVGMDPDTLASVFEPFFTTKPHGAGTGLGMSMIYGLVKQQRGYVEVESERGIGTTVRIFLPATRQRHHAPILDPIPVDRARNGTETILLVEDQFDLRRAGQRILEKFGYHVLLAADGEEAIEVYEEHRHEIDLVVTDVIMPRMGGKQLYERIGRSEGAPKFLFTSGYSADDLHRDALLEPGQPLLHKPWSLEEFVGRIQESLAPEEAAPSEDPPPDDRLVNSGRFRRLT